MKIKYKAGNILESKAFAIVNPVDCSGIMKAGLSRQFRTKYPNMYQNYKTICEKEILSVGRLNYFRDKNTLIINFPTKINFRDKVILEDIEKGLKELTKLIKRLSIHSIAIPMLGTEDNIVLQDIHTLTINTLSYYLKNKRITIYLYV